MYDYAGYDIAKMCIIHMVQVVYIYFLSSPYGKQGGALKGKILEKLGQGRLDFPGKPSTGRVRCTSEHQKALCRAQQKHEKWECLNVGMGGALLCYAKMCMTIAILLIYLCFRFLNGENYKQQGKAGQSFSIVTYRFV